MEEEKKQDKEVQGLQAKNSQKQYDKEENLPEQEMEEKLKEEPVNKKMTILNFALIIAIFIGLGIYMISVDGIDNIIEVLKSVNYGWVFLGLICIITHWLCEAITLHFPLKKLYKDHKFFISLKVAMIGQLFNNITPFATGGQPMQAYELTRDGKRISDSLSVLAMKFIVTQTALVVSSAIVVIFQLDFFINLMGGYIWIAAIGFALNIIAIVGVILVGIKKSIVTFFTTPIIKLLGKIHILKNPEHTIEKLDHSIDNFRAQFIYMKDEKMMVLKMFITSVIQSFAYYAITYAIYRAFGNSGVSLWQIIPAQAFLLLVMIFIPTPGSGLGAEGGFYLIFNSIFKEGTINMSILFWRLYTFYLPIIVGALFLIPVKKLSRKKVE